MKFAPLLFALLPMAAQAQPAAPFPANVQVSDVISAVGPGWNAPAFYKAILLRDEDYAALLIFRAPFDQPPALYAPKLAATGNYWGTVPWLEFDDNGALLLRSENRGTGRNKWEQTLTIIERDGRFIVSAFNLSAYDSIAPDNSTDCRIDMLAGTMQVNDQPITPFPLPPLVLVKDWNEDLEYVCYQAGDD